MGEMTWVLGLGEGDPVVTEEGGGRHTELGYRLDLLDPGAILRLGAVLKMGVNKGYEEGNWRKLNVHTHLNHALGHIMAWMEGHREADHLAHVMCRVMMAMGVEEDG